MSRLLPVTLVVAAILLATIVWEVRDSATSDFGSPPGRSSVPQAGRTLSAPETDDVMQGWVATALERPLFREDRRPVSTPGDPARRANGPLRLTGIITGPFGSRAIFQSADGAKPIVAEEKANLNGFVVRSIEPGKAVIVEPGGNVRTLKPSFVESEQTPHRAN